ncbi:uncharacterized protein LOC122289286 [Carya illinoinensis]|uniref:uncharacterized protein LOC122289286 n=1 Tax=Carya illinoinensis TaxID=32201 RepID=UPI001C71BA55|nr:uncharacterized protein LOC122289286 [Carya illinoinensis]
MADELASIWSSLKLTEEEQQELVLPEETIQSIKIRGSHCIFALNLNGRSVNREAFKSTMAKVWNLEGWITFKEIGFNKFLIEFQLLSDKRKVLQGRPWSFDRHLICMKDFKDDLAPNEISFKTEPFWVQLHNVPFAVMNVEQGVKLGSVIGKVHTVETDDQGCGWGRHLRIRVDVDINKPLPRGKLIKVRGKQCWIYFKYERLPNFCFKCGQLMHMEGKCSSQTTSKQSQDQYGQWLRASHAPSQNFSTKKYGGSSEQSPQDNSSPVQPKAAEAQKVNSGWSSLGTEGEATNKNTADGDQKQGSGLTPTSQTDHTCNSTEVEASCPNNDHDGLSRQDNMEIKRKETPHPSSRPLTQVSNSGQTLPFLLQNRDMCVEHSTPPKTSSNYKPSNSVLFKENLATESGGGTREATKWKRKAREQVPILANITNQQLIPTPSQNLKRAAYGTETRSRNRFSKKQKTEVATALKQNNEPEVVVVQQPHLSK